MTMLASEPAICKKCGNKQNYTKIISWNSCQNPGFLPHNKCYKCGTEIKYDDIDMSTCSPEHRDEARLNKIYERLSSKTEDDEVIVCSKCGSSELSICSTCGIELPYKYKNKENYKVRKESFSCRECGHERYLTLEEILSCGLYEFIENGEEEHEYIIKEADNYQELIDEHIRRKEEKLKQIENELISEGLITTIEEEQEYRDRYYEKI